MPYNSLKMKKSSRKLFIALCLTAACILEAIVLLRLIDRLSDEWVGIGIYSAALVAFAIAAIGFYIQWHREKAKEEEQHRTETGD